MSRVFDGSSAIVGDTSIDLVGVTNWTITVWFKVSAFVAEAVMVGRADFVGSAGFQFGVNVLGTGQVRVYLVDSFFEVIDSASTYATDAWHLVVFRRSGDTLNLRVDGVQQGTTNTFTDTQSCTAPLKLGASGDATTHHDTFTGKLSRVAIWVGTTLTDVQADALLTASPDSISPGPNFYCISAVDEVVDYGSGA